MQSEDRLIEIETKVAYQELLIEKLSEVVREQQEKISLLETALADAVKRFANRENEPEIGPAGEKPPHY